MKRQPSSEVDTSVDTSRPESVNQVLTAIGARMKAARKALRLTQDALATMAGATSNRGLQDNEAGKSMPGGQMISALVRAGINANWLLTGEGPMLVPPDRPYGVSGASAMGAAENRPGQGELHLDSLLLQQVIDFFYQWMAENKGCVRIDHARFGAVISVLYKIAAQTGKVSKPELEQVLRIAA